MKKTSAIVLLSGSLAVLAVGAEDPYQSFNRDVEYFNASIDQHLLKPVTESYINITPDPVRSAVSNVVDNLSEPVTIINDILQGKITQAAQDTARFIFNSTFGLFGLIDVATPMGLVRHDEDFGQTFATWGWIDSDYLNLPLLGPATVRDASAKPISMMLTNYGLTFQLARVLTLRESLMPVDPLIEKAPDRYVFVRDAYLQKREFDIHDGQLQTKNKLKEFDFSD